jgi:hypothetical protein
MYTAHSRLRIRSAKRHVHVGGKGQRRGGSTFSADNTLSASDLKDRLILTADMLSNLQAAVTDGRQIIFTMR